MTDRKYDDETDLITSINGKENELTNLVALMISSRVNLHSVNENSYILKETPQEAVARFRKKYGTLGYDKVLERIMKIFQQEERRQIKDLEKLRTRQKRRSNY